MTIKPSKLKILLVSLGILSSNQLKKAEQEAKAENKTLEEILIEKNLITDVQLGQLIAGELGFKFVNLKKEGIDKNIFSIIPELVAKKQLVIAFARTKEGIKLAMNDPKNLHFINLIEKKTGEKATLYYATKNDIELALDIYHKGLQEKYNELIRQSAAVAGKKTAAELPIIKLVDTLIEYAYKNNASDVHFEPHKEKIGIRFRIDGVLHHVLDLPRTLLEPIITRLKILAKLRTDEHFAAQDGKINIVLDGEEVDVRISIVPITLGEKAVLRLLSERMRQFSLESLGLGEADFQKLKTAIEKPWGMILVTGPTGCGKTTTLYSILKILNTPEVNVSTIEDPVEYDIEGVNQIQVNSRTNLTFAKGLRSIVRQDPDIIMVGEIRDDETAGISINAAMTGHLVLSTLHTNDAATTLPRLLDMGIEPFLIASTVNVIVAQRLVRKICEKCRASLELDRKSIEEIKGQFSERIREKLEQYVRDNQLTVYRGKGCEACQHTGYSGRIGIFEVMEINESIKSLIMARTNAAKIEEQAVANGMTTMLEDGLNKVMQGMTTIEEMLRATRE